PSIVARSSPTRPSLVAAGRSSRNNREDTIDRIEPRMATPTTTAEPPTLPRPSPLRWLTDVFASTVGLKFLVAVTGLALTGFVIFHLLGNLQVFAGRDAFNKYAQTLKSLGPLLWVARGGLLTVFVIHIFIALRLKKRNLDARPVPYKFERTVKASW